MHTAGHVDTAKLLHFRKGLAPDFLHLIVHPVFFPYHTRLKPDEPALLPVKQIAVADAKHRMCCRHMDGFQLFTALKGIITQLLHIRGKAEFRQACAVHKGAGTDFLQCMRRLNMGQGITIGEAMPWDFPQPFRQPHAFQRFTPQKRAFTQLLHPIRQMDLFQGNAVFEGIIGDLLQAVGQHHALQRHTIRKGALTKAPHPFRDHHMHQLCPGREFVLEQAFPLLLLPYNLHVPGIVGIGPVPHRRYFPAIQFARNVHLCCHAAPACHLHRAVIQYPVLKIAADQQFFVHSFFLSLVRSTQFGSTKYAAAQQ